MKFNSTEYHATEGMDPKVIITVLAYGAVDESSFSVHVIAKNDTATSGYIIIYMHSVRIHNCIHGYCTYVCILSRNEPLRTL